MCYNKFMNIRTITTANQIHLENETVLVLGYFDGLHLGHQELFKKARQIADEKGLKVAWCRKERQKVIQTQTEKR